MLDGTRDKIELIKTLLKLSRQKLLTTLLILKLYPLRNSNTNQTKMLSSFLTPTKNSIYN